MLFQFLARGLPQDSGRPNLSPDSNSSILGLSDEVLFVSDFIQKVTKRRKRVE